MGNGCFVKHATDTQEASRLGILEVWRQCCVSGSLKFWHRTAFAGRACSLGDPLCLCHHASCHEYPLCWFHVCTTIYMARTTVHDSRNTSNNDGWMLYLTVLSGQLPSFPPIIAKYDYRLARGSSDDCDTVFALVRLNRRSGQSRTLPMHDRCWYLPDPTFFHRVCVHTQGNAKPIICFPRPLRLKWMVDYQITSTPSCIYPLDYRIGDRLVGWII